MEKADISSKMEATMKGNGKTIKLVELDLSSSPINDSNTGDSGIMMSLMVGEHNTHKMENLGKNIKDNFKMGFEMEGEKCTSPMARYTKDNFEVERYQEEVERYVLMEKWRRRIGRQLAQPSSFLIINDE